jgi:catechol 2,3-dioxygenase-like lactoylglutathione lyase family enzyme
MRLHGLKESNRSPVTAPDFQMETNMFTHLVVGADDVPTATKFYDAALGALGYAPGTDAGNGRIVYASAAGMLLVTKPIDGNPATFGNGITVGLSAPNVAAVDAFHAQGVAAGGADEGSPGPREAIPNSYAAYLRDPTGNKLVAWCVTEGLQTVGAG